MMRDNLASESELSPESTNENRTPSAQGKVPPRVSATVPDWSRESFTRFWTPGRQLLRAIRNYDRWNKRSGIFARCFRRYHVFWYRFWSVVTGCEIPLNSSIGGGLLIPHPNGIVIHPGVVIGPNCLIFQQVTIGSKGGVAEIGGHVDIGAGARILGPVRIGDHANIGANAVVLCDVPEGATAVGIPARILPASIPSKD